MDPHHPVCPFFPETTPGLNSRAHPTLQGSTTDRGPAPCRLDYPFPVPLLISQSCERANFDGLAVRAPWPCAPVQSQAPEFAEEKGGAAEPFGSCLG